MEFYPYLPSVFLFAAALLLFWQTRRRTRKIMEHMNDMLEAAADGSFREEVYDESMLSAVETRLAHYLAASEVSAQNRNEEKEKVKQLIADISHQIKTPVANLLLYAQMLQERLEEKRAADEELAFVGELSRQAQKLDFFIGSLVKASRLETGMIVLHPQWGLVAPMLAELVSQIAAKARAKGQTVEVAPDNGVSAYFDQKWTVEAIYNIVDNAVKYTPPGGVIRISVMVTEMFVRIAVTDTGIGIPEADTPRIFKRFYRGSDASAEEGAGIGLYLARQIIADENGYIKVKSEVGRGSTFYIYLPNRKEPVQGKAASE